MTTAAECDRQSIADHHRIKRKQREAADKPELFGQGREDEIGLLFRQKAQMALAAVEKASAEKTARTQRDLRLQNMIAGAERIALWIEKGVDTVLLVGAKKMPAGRQGGCGRETDQTKEPQAHADGADPETAGSPHRRSALGLRCRDPAVSGSAPSARKSSRRAGSASGSAQCPRLSGYENSAPAPG